MFPWGVKCYMIANCRNQLYYGTNSPPFQTSRFRPFLYHKSVLFFFFPGIIFFPRHLRKPPWHRLSRGKKKRKRKRMVQLEMIACFSLLPCPRDFSRKPFHIIVIRRGNLLICMVAALLQAQGRENGRQQGAKCAFNLNNPFNLSSIMWRQLGALILLQSERSALEITSSRSRVGEGAGGGGSLVVQKSCDRKLGPVGVVTGKTSDWWLKLKARRELKEIF